MSEETKPDLSAFMPEGWEGKLPPCMIQVDAEGRMSHDGAPMVHPGIIELIYESVYYEDGLYFLKVGQQRCQLEVADTFHVVQRAWFDDDGVMIHLSDGSQERLDPATLRLGDEGVLYCAIKNGAFPARFLRQAYYQLTERLVEDGDGYAIEIAGRRWRLA